MSTYPAPAHRGHEWQAYERGVHARGGGAGDDAGGSVVGTLHCETPAAVCAKRVGGQEEEGDDSGGELVKEPDDVTQASYAFFSNSFYRRLAHLQAPRRGQVLPDPIRGDPFS
ncbi:hypothetical protein EJ110_NYTH16464 [Nymphaea thermarum]|nr:hypothetical protein EJ110_NYTH16464 [Nymphaea thermarum]